MLPGHATAAGTTAYGGRFPELRRAGHFRVAQQLTLPSIGLGTYLGGTDEAADAEYTAAVEEALRGGINLLDTAINYRHQRSERNIGAALAKLVAAGELRREELFVCTKAGYIAFDGDVPADPRAWVEQQFFANNLVPQEQRNQFLRVMHSMAPRYLADQLQRSRQNLGLETIDLFYLHNPEAELGLVAATEYVHRISDAFAFLEEQVRGGTVRFYGIATWNGLRVPPGEREFLPLQALVEAAQKAGGNEHHFRFVQLPFNLALPQAWSVKNQPWEGEMISAIEAAGRAGMTVVTSATLMQGRLTSDLPEFVTKRLKMAKDAENAIQFSRSAPGVTTALIGMGRPEHVRANVSVVGHPLTPGDEWKKLFP